MQQRYLQTTLTLSEDFDDTGDSCLGLKGRWGHIPHPDPAFKLCKVDQVDHAVRNVTGRFAVSRLDVPVHHTLALRSKAKTVQTDPVGLAKNPNAAQINLRIFSSVSNDLEILSVRTILDPDRRLCGIRVHFVPWPVSQVEGAQ
jgi:hypothetical protein